MRITREILLILTTALSISACERSKTPPAAADLAPAAREQADLGPGERGRADVPATDVAAAQQPEATNGCSELRGAQQMTLHPTTPAGDDRFRFGDEPDALEYQTVWRGDLNDDGIEDRIARRTSGKSDKVVTMVLVGCGEQFALVRVGTDEVRALQEATRVGERSWRDLEAPTERLQFDGAKYRAKR